MLRVRIDLLIWRSVIKEKSILSRHTFDTNDEGRIGAGRLTFRIRDDAVNHYYIRAMYSYSWYYKYIYID